VLGRNYVAVTWSGGANGWRKTCFEALRGREITIWPDNDEPGNKCGIEIAQKLLSIAKSVKILKVKETTMPVGWDCADAFTAEAWTYDDFIAFAKPIAQTLEYDAVKVEVQQSLVEERKQEEKAITQGAAKNMQLYLNAQAFGYDCGTNGVPKTTADNCLRFLEGRGGEDFDLWLDVFHQKVFIKWPGSEARPIQDHDEVKLLIACQRDWFFSTCRLTDLRGAIGLYTHQRRRNEPKEWLESLAWDGVPRVGMFFQEYFGAAESHYTSKIGNNFWISLAARIIDPGCKVDTMVVLEGLQGKGKSTALAIIGGKWFTEVEEEFGTKDFYQKLQGRILVEIAELHAMGRSDIKKVKNTLSQRIDNFRPPYGRHVETFPRQCLFVGTTNDDSYLNDPTGARRFWPMLTAKIDYELLRQDREQLFAEALQLFKSGETWWDVPKEETEEQQWQRFDLDEWVNIIDPWLLAQKTDRVAVLDILFKCLAIEPGRMDKAAQMRVASVLKYLGWTKARRKKGSPNEWERKKPIFGMFGTKKEVVDEMMY